MLRKKKDNSDYEIDRELTGKFAIEKNAEYQDRIAELEEENKKLNENYKALGILNDEIRRVNENLREENKRLKHENSYRAGIVDILPKRKGHIAEETIQDLQARINELKEELESTQKEFQQYKEHYNIEKDKQQIFLMTGRKY